MFEKKYFGPCLTKPVTMNVNHATIARNSGIASRDVAGNWMNGTTDQMLMKKIQKNSVAKKGVHFLPSSPIAATLMFSSIGEVAGLGHVLHARRARACDGVPPYQNSTMQMTVETSAIIADLVELVPRCWARRCPSTRRAR